MPHHQIASPSNCTIWSISLTILCRATSQTNSQDHVARAKAINRINPKWALMFCWQFMAINLELYKQYLIEDRFPDTVSLSLSLLLRLSPFRVNRDFGTHCGLKHINAGNARNSIVDTISNARPPIPIDLCRSNDLIHFKNRKHLSHSIRILRWIHLNALH